MTKHAVTLDEDLLEQVRLWADRDDRTVQDLVDEAVRAYLHKAYDSFKVSIGDQVLDADLLERLHNEGGSIEIQAKSGDTVTLSLVTQEDGSERLRISSDRLPFVGSHPDGPPGTRTVDLLEALRASVEAARRMDNPQSSKSDKRTKRGRQERLEDAG
jgi:hypothetical protein